MAIDRHRTKSCGQLFDSFSAAFDGPSMLLLKGKVIDERVEKIQRVIDHPSTPEPEREAARAALRRLDG